jgi:hypothetical protein
MGVKNAGEMNFIPTHQLLAETFNVNRRADENLIP